MKRVTLLLTTLLASISMSTTAFAGGDKSFSDIDKDGDQNVSQQELQEAGKDNLSVDQYDQDNDGVLGQDEFEQAQQSSGSSGSMDESSGSSGSMDESERDKDKDKDK